MRFRVTAFGTEDRASMAQARRLRETVFCGEQGVDPALEWDGLDDRAVHFLLWEDDTAMATARVRRYHGALKIERVAVYREHRGRGVGRMLMDYIVYVLRRLTESEPARVILHAQTAVEDFYRRLGFVPEGNVFVEAGIPHVAMTLSDGSTLEVQDAALNDSPR
jgi:predicted GNAT family N-acyltransferase